MNKYLKRITHESPGVPHNLLLWPFLLMTLARGIAYGFFSHAESVQNTALHRITIESLPPIALEIWGYLAILVVIMVILGLATESRWIYKPASWLGVGLWIWVTGLFLIDMFWMQILAVGVPNLFFWVWYWLSVKRYYD